MVNVIDLITWFFVSLGVIGIYAAIIITALYLYGRYQNKKLRKNIPEKVIKEVKNENRKKEIKKERARKFYGTELDTDGDRGDWEDNGDRTGSDVKNSATLERQRNIQIQQDTNNERTSKEFEGDKRDTEKDWPSFN